MLIFKIMVPSQQGGLDEQLNSLSVQLVDMLKNEKLTLTQLLVTRIYLSDAANQLEVLHQHPLWLQLKAGAISFIEQPLLSGEKVALHCVLTTELNVEKVGTPERMKMSIGALKILFQSVRFTAAEAKSLSAEEETIETFRRHQQFLKEEGLTLEANCHRTWFYVRDVDRNYQGVVVGRNKVFAKEGLTGDTHYIASTGIGGYPSNAESIVCADFLSVDGLQRNDVRYLQALKYLNPTREYGVAFERATSLDANGQRYLMLSGTASIDNQGKVLYERDVQAQTERLFLNIEKLLNDGGASLSNLEYAIVYLRDISDYPVVAAYLKKRLHHLPVLIVEARVCRPGWLIEVEGIARLALS